MSGDAGVANAPRRLNVAAAVVWDGARILMTQRLPGGALGSMWEFPGGKLEPGETPEQAVVREVREELGVEAQVIERLHVEQHEYPGGPSVEITFLRCTLAEAPLTAGDGVHAWRWIEPRGIDLGTVLEADRAFIAALGARDVAS